MASENTFRREYIARFNRVHDYIDAHLSEELRLEQLAAVALFSPFHFHRLFLAWQGETVAEYVRRRRLEVAASRLRLLPDAPILEIALDYGFSSGESFARAFRQQFACTPTQWRQRPATDFFQRADQNSKIGQAFGKIDQACAGVMPHDYGMDQPSRPIPNPELIMDKLITAADVKVETLPVVHIAYLRYTGPYAGEGIGQHWQRFNQWCAVHGMTGQRPMYGISLDDPHVTAPEQCRYDAAVLIEPDFKATGEAAVRDLPGGRYALYEFFGTPQECALAWTSFCRDWLPDSGYVFDERPCLEIYLPNHAYETEPFRFGCQLALPVKPL